MKTYKCTRNLLSVGYKTSERAGLLVGDVGTAHGAPLGADESFTPRAQRLRVGRREGETLAVVEGSAAFVALVEGV